jgi:cholesterol transport system auxiliary component
MHKNTAIRALKPAIGPRFLKMAVPVLLAATVAGCVSLGSDPPPQLLTLTADQQAASGNQVASNIADAIVVEIPNAQHSIDTTRVPVQINDSSIAYVEEAVWADKPAHLFQSVLSETIAAQTGRLVLNQIDSGGQRGMILSGDLLKFGYDAGLQSVVVCYDAILRMPGQPLRKQRFEAEQSVFKVEATEVGAALNIAANKVANDVAVWVKGS